MTTATKDCPSCGAENHWKASACQHCQAPLRAWTPPSRPTRVQVVDLDLPFGSIVVLMLKWTLAAIPAFVILAVVAAILIGVLGGIGALAVAGG